MAAREKGIELAPSTVEELPDEFDVYLEAMIDLADDQKNWVTLNTYAEANGLADTDFVAIMQKVYRKLQNGDAD